MTTPTPLPPLTMERLAFIRLLHQEAVTQAQRPAPLNRISILTFHDAVEHFLILAGEQLNASLPSHTPFLKYWTELHPSKIPNGVELSGKVGMDRLNRRRNDFKHLGQPPGDEAIEFAQNDVASFLEDNTPRVFGIAYYDIGMADLVVQDAARRLLGDAQAKVNEGDLIEAMALLVEAFDGLFIGRPWSPTEAGAYMFGDEISRPMDKQDIRAVLEHSRESRKAIPTQGAGKLADQIVTVTGIAAELQAATRIMALGIDYHKYDRFRLLTPSVDYMYSGDRRVNHHPAYAPSRDDYSYCERFVVTVALRLTEVDAHRVLPTWAP